MMKRLIPLILSFILTFTTIGAAYAAETTTTAYRIQPLLEKLASITDADLKNALDKYTDMKTHWSRENVGKLTILEIIKGYGNGKFMPDSYITADAFIKMTVMALGFKPEQGSKYWAEPFIKIAKEQKLVDTGDFTDYTKPITREQMAKIIVRATTLKEAAPNQDMYNLVRSKIKDYTKIGDKYKQFVVDAYMLGLLTGSNGVFDPKGYTKRGESCTVILRNLDVKTRKPFTPAPDEMMTFVYPDGEKYTLYAPSISEVMKTAYVLKNSLSKDNGYTTFGYSRDIKRVVSGFYESEEKFKEPTVDNLQLAIDIKTLESELIHPYYIVVYNPAAVKKLHREVIVELFKYLFEKESDKAINEFDRYLTSSINDNSELRKDFTFNSRQVVIFRGQGDSGFGMGISVKK